MKAQDLASVVAGVDELTRRVAAIQEQFNEVLEAIRWRGEEWIPAREAARRLEMSTGGLAIWRVTGKHGLRYCQPGQRVMYYAADVDRLRRSLVQVCTADEPRALETYESQEVAHVR